jgi:hypothetical protein
MCEMVKILINYRKCTKLNNNNEYILILRTVRKNKITIALTSTFIHQKKINATLLLLLFLYYDALALRMFSNSKLLLNNNAIYC